MRRPCRLAINLALIAAACSLSLSVVPASAATNATAGTITIGAAGSPVGNRGLLSVSIVATTPIVPASLTAHLLSLPARKDVLDVSDFALTSGTTTSGIWTVQTAITQQQLPLGEYLVLMDAADTGGDSVSGARALAPLRFIITPSITVSASPTSISYGAQTVMFSGAATGEWPDGTVKPLDGQQITISDRGSFTIGQTTAGAGGSYQVSVTVPGLPAFPKVYAEIATSATMSGIGQFVQITDLTDPVRLTAQFTSPTVNYGSTATLTGLVSYQSGSNWKPLAGIKVTISRTSDGPPRGSVTAVTGQDGTFSAALADQNTNGARWSAQAGPVTPFLGQGSADAFLTIDFPTAITGFKAKPTARQHISVSGCLRVTAGTVNAPSAAVRIQYSKHAAGLWKSIGSLRSAIDGPASCPGSEHAYFHGSLHAPGSGYYRADFTGATGYQPATSKSVFARIR